MPCNFFVMGKKREEDFCDKLIHVSVANHNDYDASGNLRATLQSKSSFQTKIRILFSVGSLNSLRFTLA